MIPFQARHETPRILIHSWKFYRDLCPNLVSKMLEGSSK